MTRTPRPDWPPAAISHLEQMHADGLTFDEIARRLKAMNYAFTRNACIGKAGRMRLPRRLTASDVAVLKARTDPKNPKKRTRKRSGIVKDTVAPPMQSPPLAPKNTTRGRLLVDLAWNQCRWPETEIAHATYLYCTEDAEPYRSFCAEHCAKAYQPVGRR